MMGLLGYISCDEEKKSKLREAEKEETITLRVVERDVDRAILI